MNIKILQFISLLFVELKVFIFQMLVRDSQRQWPFLLLPLVLRMLSRSSAFK